MNEHGIEELIGTLYEMVQDARSVPFSSDKCAVEREKVLDLLDEISNQLPGELKQAKTIVDSRSELITNAKREAENIMKSAQAQARQLVSQEAIYLEAKNQANDMVRAAQDKIKELKKVTNDYVDDSLRRTEEAVAEALSAGQSAAIYDVCLKTMGNVGVALAMIGVVICPITSGDTAFRSARLTLSDWLKIDQDSYVNRLKLCIPVLGVGSFLGIGNALGFINYTVIWRYFSWTNQTLAMIVLWAASMYLFKEKKNYWITAVPATFMSAVSSTYFILAPECLGGLLNAKTAEGATIYNTAVAYPIGIIFAIAMLAVFLHATKKAAQKA